MNGFKRVLNEPKIMWVNDNNIDTLRLEAEYYKEDYVECIEKIKSFKNDMLGNIVNDVKDGPGGWGIKASEYVEFGVPMLRGVNIVDGILTLEECVYITHSKQQELKRSKVCKNDVLLAVRGSTGVGKSTVYSLDTEANMNAAVVKLTVKQDVVEPYYLSCFFNSKYGRLQTERIANGVNQQNINLTEVKSNIIPLPALKIQKYIGDKVRKAEELREEVKRLRKDADELIYNIIELQPLEEVNNKYTFANANYIDCERLDSQYYSAKYIELEKRLNKRNIMKLEEIIVSSKYGASISANYVEKGIHFIRGKNLNANEIDNTDIVCLDNSFQQDIGKCTVNIRDILITRSGTVGITAVVDESCNGFAFGSFMIKLIVKEEWNPYYIAAFLNSFWGSWQINRLKNGAVQQNINLQEIGRIVLPKISIDNQNKVEEIIKLYINKKRQVSQLIKEAKQDIEDLLEGNFDMSKIKKINEK